MLPSVVKPKKIKLEIENRGFRKKKKSEFYFCLNSLCPVCVTIL